MAKLTLTDIASGYASPAAHNANYDAIETALENTLSRDGTSPNAMQASLDMDSNPIINLGAPTNSTAAARLVDISDSDATGAASAQLRIDLAANTGSSLVGHKHSGTDAVDMTVQTVLRETENLSRFGFGTTKTASQNVTAWQRALSEGSIGELRVNPGDYTVGDLEPINDCVWIHGSGAHGQTSGSFGTKGARTTNFVHTGSTQCIEVEGSGGEGKAGIHISDLMITGTSAADYGILMGSGVNLDQCSVQRTCIRDFTKHGAAAIAVGNCLNSLFAQNLFVANFYGALVGGASYAPTTLTWMRNRFYGNNSHGMVWRSGVSSTLLGNIGESNFGFGLFIEAASTVGNLDIFGINSEDNARGYTITNAADNGAGLIRLTVASHPFATGDKAYVGGIVGTTEANNTTTGWTVTKIDANTVDLQGSSFSNAYVSGGKIGFGNAPIGMSVTGAGTNPLDIRFYGGEITDDITANTLCDSVRSFNFDYGSNILLDCVNMQTLAAGCIRITNNVHKGRLVVSGWGGDVPESIITGNHIDGFMVGSARYRDVFTLSASGDTPFGTTQGVVMLRDITSNKTALYALNGSANSVTELSDPDAGFTTAATSGGSNQIHLCYDAGAYRIGNGYAVPHTIIVEVFMAGHAT